jgi:hypothetical protein
MKYADKAFENVTVQTDGNSYARCEFLNCTLIYSGGDPPSLEGCTFDPPKFAFRGAAGNTLNFLRAMYHGGFRDYVEATFDDIRSNAKSAGGTT